MTVKYTHTNEEWFEMMVKYNEDKSADAFAEIYEELKPVAHAIGRKIFTSNKGYGIPVEEFINEAEFAIWKLTEEYDVTREKVGSVPAMLKQLAAWSISDNLIRPLQSKQRKFEKEALYAAANFEGADGSVGAAVLDNVVDPEAEFVEALMEEESENNLISLLATLLEGFAVDNNADDVKLVTEIFYIIQNHPDANKKMVNVELSKVFPDLKSATLRKKKQRSLDRFTEFCQTNGYSSFNMSQF